MVKHNKYSCIDLLARQIHLNPIRSKDFVLKSGTQYNQFNDYILSEQYFIHYLSLSSLITSYSIGESAKHSINIAFYGIFSYVILDLVILIQIHETLNSEP